MTNKEFWVKIFGVNFTKENVVELLSSMGRFNSKFNLIYGNENCYVKSCEKGLTLNYRKNDYYSNGDPEDFEEFESWEIFADDFFRELGYEEETDKIQNIL